MQRRQILKAISLFLVGWTSSVYAQSPDNKAVRLFDIAAAKHKRELRNLWQERETPQIEIPDASASSIAKVLAVKSEEYNETVYPKKTGVLFYSYEAEAKNLQVWLLNEQGIQAYHNQS